MATLASSNRYSLFYKKSDNADKKGDDVEKLLRLALEHAGAEGQAYYEKAIEQLRVLGTHHPKVQHWVSQLRIAIWPRHEQHLVEQKLAISDISHADDETFDKLKLPVNYERFCEYFKNRELPAALAFQF